MCLSAQCTNALLPVQPELQSLAVNTAAEQSSHNQRRKRTSSGLVVLNGGANPEGSLASGSSAIEYQEKYKLGSECGCGCSGVTIIWTMT